MNRIFFILFFLGFATLPIQAQEPESKIVIARVVDGDTLITYDLPEYLVTAKMPRKLKKLARQNARLVYNVKKAYPYAKIAGLKLREYEVILRNANSDAERRKIMKQAEEELKEEFEDDLRKLTFKQGLILIKLVDRETGNSSYVLIQELRGKFVAFFWQTFARIFGYNLKTEYDPEAEDRNIEEIVVMIENGEL
jgi:hypothetical protein